MKFILSTKDLNTLINQCQGVIPQKPAMAILSNFFIEASEGFVTITATDLTVGIQRTVPAKVLKAGSTTVPAKKFGPLIKELTSLNVEIATNSNHVTEISADTSHFKMNGIGAEEYPNLPNMADGLQLRLPQAQLLDLLYRTAFAVSREDNRYTLTGVFLQIHEGRATCVGTDGKRLSRSFVSVPVDASFSGKYIIPLRAVEEMIRSLSATDEEAILILMPDKIALQTGQTTIISKLLSGEYPDVERIIPQKSDAVISLHREELTTLLRQIALFTNTDTHSVKFSFLPGELKLAVNTMDVGEGKVGMPVNYNGPLIEIAFNPNYFLDVLRHTKSETVSLGLTDSFNPGVITDIDNPGDQPRELNSLFILMPMRLNET